MDWLADAINAAADSEPVPLTVIPDVVPGRTLNLDGDYLAYFMAGNDETSLGTAVRNALQRIINFKEMSGSEKCTLHLTDGSSDKAGRYLIASLQPYQANREGSVKPKNWAGLRAFLEQPNEHFTPKIWYDREADDGMALAQYIAFVKKFQHLSVSGTRDKDMRQYGGLHIGWMDYVMVEVPWDAFRLDDHNGLWYGHAWLWAQCLQGDSVDGIPGLPKYLKENGKYGLMGDKTAAKFLDSATSDEEAFRVVAKLYGGKWLGMWGEMLAEQLMLLWLRRDEAAHPMDFLRHLRLDRSTDNFKDLAAGAVMVMQRMAAAKEQIREIEERANRASSPAVTG